MQPLRAAVASKTREPCLEPSDASSALSHRVVVPQLVSSSPPDFLPFLAVARLSATPLPILTSSRNTEY